MFDRYRIDNVPLVLQVPFLVYGYVLGSLWWGFLLLMRLTIAVRVTGKQNLSASSNYIFCLWHESGPLSFQGWTPRFPAYLRQRPHAWLQHPPWYTKPVAVLIGLLGVQRLVLGSTGHDGRQAADELVTYLKEGYSTLIAPDGPSGPARKLRKGVLHIALQSGVAIVPLHVSATRCFRSSSWDRKMQPLPFSTIHVAVGSPMVVTTSTFEESFEALTHALG